MNSKISSTSRVFHLKGLGLFLILGIIFSGCTSVPEIKVSGNLNGVSERQIIAILPVETTDDGQNEAATLFRRGLYANLKQAKFQVMERYVVDALLKNQGLTDPAEYSKISPMKLGEILGADAVILSKMVKVQRLYLIVHASIEVALSAQMLDTRSGEVLWQANQTKIGFEGIGKIPTGMIAAGYGPLQYITNKMNLFKITKGIANSMTALVKTPQLASEEQTFDQPEITVAALDDFDDIKGQGKYFREPSSDNQYAAIEKEEPMDPLVVASAIIEEPEPFMEEPVQQEHVVEPQPVTELMNLDEPIAPKVEMKQVSPIESQPEIKLASYQVPNSKPFTAPDPVAMDPEMEIEHVASAKDPVIEEKAVPEIQPVFDTFYSIQVGAYKTKSMAQAMVNKLSSKGFSGFVSLFTKEGDDSLYKVRVQKFDNKQDAVKYAKEFMGKENIDYFVTKVQLNAIV